MWNHLIIYPPADYSNVTIFDHMGENSPNAISTTNGLNNEEISVLNPRELVFKMKH